MTAADTTRARAGKLRTIVPRTIIYILLGILALVFLAPFLTMLLTSLKDMEEIRTGNLFALPQQLSFSAWSTVWNKACIGTECGGLKNHFMVSFLMAIPSVLISVALGALNGYVLTKWRFRGDNIVFALILFGCFIPFQIILLPMARLLGSLNMAGSIPALVLVHVVYGIPFTTMFFRNFFISIPEDLTHAARVDGAGFWMIFLRILLPVSLPIAMVSVIWQFTAIWNDFLFGVSFASGSGQPVTVALNNLVNTSSGVKMYNQDMAAAIITALPTLVVYVLSGRYFVRGLMAGSVKG